VKTRRASILQQRVSGGFNAYPSPFFATIQTSTKICGGVVISENLILSAASCTERFVNFFVYLIEVLNLNFQGAFNSVLNQIIFCNFSAGNDSLTVMVGFYSPDQTTDYQIFNETAPVIYLHPGYNRETFANDLSIIDLEGLIPFSGTFSSHLLKLIFLQYTFNFAEDIYPINLPIGQDSSTNYEGKPVYFNGFGSTTADQSRFETFLIAVSAERKNRVPTKFL